MDIHEAVDINTVKMTPCEKIASPSKAYVSFRAYQITPDSFIQGQSSYSDSGPWTPVSVWCPIQGKYSDRVFLLRKTDKCFGEMRWISFPNITGELFRVLFYKVNLIDSREIIKARLEGLEDGGIYVRWNKKEERFRVVDVGDVDRSVVSFSFSTGGDKKFNVITSIIASSEEDILNEQG